MDVLVRPSALRRASPAQVRLISLAAIVVVIVASLFTVRLTADARLQSWTQSCAAGGGAVLQLEVDRGNPLVTESNDPTYECRTPDGTVLSHWR
ncbi:MAG TPA: hypothetical protein VIT20_05160 [Propionibacteriaceae bacterium]